MRNPGSHAIVIGAGMGGLVAARMLADHYQCVTILERDVLPLEAAPRKGVPHGRHAHGLLARGREALEELFPGLTDGLIEAGAVPIDTLADSRWFSHGVYLANATSGLRSILLSRPLLETHVRRRLLAHGAVCIRENAAVRRLTVAGDRVTGIKLQSGEAIEACLIVDASGRHSHSPGWLVSAMKYPPRRPSASASATRHGSCAAARITSQARPLPWWAPRHPAGGLASRWPWRMIGGSSLRV